MIDRFSRWPTAEPLADITAESVCRGFILGWVAHNGCPKRLTCDRGRQFESGLFKKLCATLGIALQPTTSYHPQADGMLERWHRPLKTALMAHSSESWIDALPMVLLGLRTTWRENLNTSPAELLYGEQLRLPGDFFTDSPANLDSAYLVSRLRAHMSEVRPTPATHHSNSRKIFVHKALATKPYVLLRQDAVQTAFQPPYLGPYPVITRSEKTFTININGKPTVVSIDRLKPAHILQSDDFQERTSRPSEPTSGKPSSAPSTGTSPSPADTSAAPPPTTRSGRTLCSPVRYHASCLSTGGVVWRPHLLPRRHTARPEAT
ncbi:uncharacterized protein LOC124170572 [Ischnura elegans]|uniref:uncharacterized protein LOC124170572 n=1 Tax=Ischnura elegans TaxID=197161 RepID=UPI001ED8A41E|nr:uncharacterized protein LOC124170572 [Ischnura elegans]